MASSGMILLAFFLLALCMKGSNAQSGCTNVLIGMSACLNYVTGSSKTPTSSCCSSLANVVQSQPQCLCSALDGSALAGLGISIDKKAALALPGACNVKTPPVSRCNGGGSAAPVMPPASSPQSSDVESSNGPSPTSLSETGPRKVLENGESSNAGGHNKMQYMLVLSVLVVLLLANFLP